MAATKMAGNKIVNHLFTFTCFAVLSLCADGRSNRLSHKNPDYLAAESNGKAGTGRVIQIPAVDYIAAFKVKAPELGDCALKMEGKRIISCSEKFGGQKVWIPASSTGVDVSRVETVSDVLKHGMGGIGASIGVLGLASIGTKYSVAVTTQTSNRHLTLMSSYDIKRGVMTLQNPHPVSGTPADGSLYLSEVQYGGNEIFLVTMEFESVQTRIEVQMELKIKILFITISAKLRHVKEMFKSASNTRIRFKSSWRENLDKSFTSLDMAIEEAEKIEAMYLEGPEELMKKPLEDEKLLSTYYFSSWKESPYGRSANMASVNNDLNILSEQQAEIESVLNRIKDSIDTRWMELVDPKKKKLVDELQEEMKAMNTKLVNAIESYHTLSEDDRTELLDIYGTDKAPGYYERRLKQILGY